MTPRGDMMKTPSSPTQFSQILYLGNGKHESQPKGIRGTFDPELPYPVVASHLASRRVLSGHIDGARIRSLIELVPIETGEELGDFDLDLVFILDLPDAVQVLLEAPLELLELLVAHMCAIKLGIVTHHADQSIVVVSDMAQEHSYPGSEAYAADNQAEHAHHTSINDKPRLFPGHHPIGAFPRDALPTLPQNAR